MKSPLATHRRGAFLTFLNPQRTLQLTRASELGIKEETNDLGTSGKIHLVRSICLMGQFGLGGIGAVGRQHLLQHLPVFGITCRSTAILLVCPIRDKGRDKVQTPWPLYLVLDYCCLDKGHPGNA